MPDWIIRRAVQGDAAALARCIAEAYSIYDDRGLDLPKVADGIPEAIATTPVWVAEREGRIAGGLILRLSGDAAQLENIAVAPWAAGAGVGRKLINRAEAEARNLGKKSLDLATHVGLTENIALYTHLGWVETGRDGLKVLMRKPL